MKKLNKNEVLNLLKEGHQLIKTRFIGYTSVTINDQFVNKNSFNSLIKNGIVKFDHNIDRSRSVYILIEK